MAFPRSVVFHFPPKVHQSTGSSQMLPQLLRALSPDKVSAIQFLRNGKARVTLSTAKYRDKILQNPPITFRGVPVPVTASDVRIRVCP